MSAVPPSRRLFDMYRSVLVGHDLARGGQDALSLAKVLVAATGAELVIAGVLPFNVLPQDLPEEETAAELKRIADSAAAAAEAVRSTSPARGLHELAEEVGADLVVIGSSRHSEPGRTLAGSVGLGLLNGAPCAVAIAPRRFSDREGDRQGRIVVGIDGSAEAAAALADAVELARRTGSEIKLVAVADALEAHESGMRRHLRSALASVPEAIKIEASLITGDPAAKLAQAARGASLLVLGSRGYGPIRRVLLGSVASTLVRCAPSPVLVRPRPETREIDATPAVAAR